ncbi:hypothetical protein HS048_13445 [Planomonospora sp. ID91781]|uniref:hypothetical protein n=1 Tax=Planomonospora sp. ID91781 TaxID=2738135 RepID=UPI0018C373F8|nr:hypothetical protein [Planomonospora sp. ID91781]MBG0821740.1 hypothetical protein [Planomonospora sp. ID91781]
MPTDTTRDVEGLFDLEMRSIPVRAQAAESTPSPQAMETTPGLCTYSPYMSSCTQPTCTDTCCDLGSRVC